MFSLIITVISLVLVILISLMTYFYGGDLLFEGKTRVDAARLLNDIAQIDGAIELHRVKEHKRPETQDDLVPEYLHILPLGWEASDDMVGYLMFTTHVENSVCMEINNRLGIENPDGDPPQCDPDLGVEESVSFKGCCIPQDG